MGHVRCLLLVTMLSVLGAVACDNEGDDARDGGDSDSDVDSDTDTDRDTDSDTGSETDSQTDTDTSSGTDTGPECASACPQWSHCEDGECACDRFFTQCGELCVRLGTHGHCSACDDACEDDWVCEGGECRPPCGGPCEEGFECCDDECEDTMNDSNNCGSCGNICENGSPCWGGQCGWKDW